MSVLTLIFPVVIRRVKAFVLAMVLCSLSLPAHAVCTNPGGAAGNIVFDSNRSIMTYCDDINWISMGASSLSNGLIRYYKFDEASGTNVTDSSGLGGNTTISTGASWLPAGGRMSGAINTINHYVSSGALNGHLSSTNISLAGWMKTSANVDWLNFASLSWGAGTGGWNLYTDAAGTAHFGIMQGGVQRRVQSANAVVFNQWQHYVGTYDGTTLKLYINGALVASSAAYAGVSLLTTGSASMVRGPAHFDDVRIYNRVITQEEVTQLYSLGSSGVNPTNLSAYWRMENNLLDSAGTNNGTGINSPSYAVGHAGQALRLNGTTQRVSIPAHSSIKPASLPVTFAAYVYLNALDGSTRLFESDGSSSGYFGYWIGIQPTGQLGVHYGSGGGAGPSSRRSKHSTAAISAGRWYHVAAVIRGAGDIDIYIDGVDAGGTYTGTGGAYLPGTNPAFIGYSSISGSHLYGMVDELVIYTRSLNASEIAQLAQSGCSTPLGSAGDIVFDSNQNIMTYCNGSAWISMGKGPQTGGGCASPAAVAGHMIYDSNTNILVYCDGYDWVRIGK